MEAARAVDDSALAVEDLLFQRYLAAGDVKTYPAEMKLYLKLVWLAGEVGDGAGDVAGSPDLAPTTQDIEVFHLLEGRAGEGAGRLRAARGHRPCRPSTRPWPRRGSGWVCRGAEGRSPAVSVRNASGPYGSDRLRVDTFPISQDLIESVSSTPW